MLFLFMSEVFKDSQNKNFIVLVVNKTKLWLDSRGLERFGQSDGGTRAKDSSLNITTQVIH